MHGSQGKNHDYIVMCKDLSPKRYFKVSMEDYIMKAIQELPSDIKGMASTPAMDNLCEMTTQKICCTGHKIAFHHSVVQLLFNM